MKEVELPYYGMAGFCPSNGIARRLNAKGRDVEAQIRTEKAKTEALKNGQQAIQWQDLKQQIISINKEIEVLKQDLEIEKRTAIALGIDNVAHGMGWWCNEAVKRRKRAENFLAGAERELGKVKGYYQKIVREQTEGIKIASTEIQQRQEVKERLVTDIANIKQQINQYKLKRDNKNDGTEKSKTSAVVGILKENGLLIASGIALVTVLVLKKSKNDK